METFIVIAIIIQILFALYVSFKLWQISNRVKRTANSTEDNFHLNLFNTYERNPTFRKVHRVLQLPPNNQEVIDLFSGKDTDLFKYLKFLNFVAGIHSDDNLRLETIYQRFNEQFDALRKHKELYGDLLRKKYFYVEFLLDRR